MNDDEIIKRFKKMQRDEESRQKKYGKVNPIIQNSIKGVRFVAVGNELHYSKNWVTFPDFLLDYIWHLFGKDWFKEEVKKAKT